MVLQAFAARALVLGADDAVVFTTEEIAFDSRTILKCMFGCEDWGKGHTCPSRPNSLKPWEYQKILENYSGGILVHSRSKKVAQDVSFALEKEAFLKGFPFAFSMSDCAVCPQCAGMRGEECVHPKKARPAFHSVGIDVFKMARHFGLPLKALVSEEEEQNWYSAVFIE